MFISNCTIYLVKRISDGGEDVINTFMYPIYESFLLDCSLFGLRLVQKKVGIVVVCVTYVVLVVLVIGGC